MGDAKTRWVLRISERRTSLLPHGHSDTPTPRHHRANPTNHWLVLLVLNSARLGLWSSIPRILNSPHNRKSLFRTLIDVRPFVTMSNPQFWSTPLRYIRWAAHEKPAIFFSLVIGSMGPVALVSLPPIRRALGDVDPEPIPLSYPSKTIIPIVSSVCARFFVVLRLTIMFETQFRRVRDRSPRASTTSKELIIRPSHQKNQPKEWV